MDEVYFKATGEKRKIIEQWDKESVDGINKLIESFKDLYGGVSGYIATESGVLAVSFNNHKEVDMKVWRKTSNDKMLVPRKKNKDAIRFSELMESISIPSPLDLRIRLNLWCVGGMGLEWANGQPYIKAKECHAETYRKADNLKEIKASAFYRAKEKEEALKQQEGKQ